MKNIDHWLSSSSDVMLQVAIDGDGAYVASLTGTAYMAIGATLNEALEYLNELAEPDAED